MDGGIQFPGRRRSFGSPPTSFRRRLLRGTAAGSSAARTASHRVRTRRRGRHVLVFPPLVRGIGIRGCRHRVEACVRPCSPVIFASPKSVRWGSPRSSIRMFDGFTSRWSTPCGCANSIASATCAESIGQLRDPERSAALRSAGLSIRNVVQTLRQAHTVDQLHAEEVLRVGTRRFRRSARSPDDEDEGRFCLQPKWSMRSVTRAARRGSSSRRRSRFRLLTALGTRPPCRLGRSPTPVRSRQNAEECRSRKLLTRVKRRRTQ